MGRLHFDYETSDSGIRLFLKERRGLLGDKGIRPGQWADRADDLLMIPIGRLLALADEQADDPNPAVSPEENCFLLKHSLVASLEEYIALRLGLPPATTLVLGLDCRGNISQPNFDVHASWLSGGTMPAAGARVYGSILLQGGNSWRIPEPLFSIWHNVQEFRKTDTADDATRFRLLSELIERFPSAEQARLRKDNYLSRMRIVHASAFSLHLSTDANGFRFDPVLFGRRVRNQWAEGEGQTLVSEAESLLPEIMQEKFARERFPAYSECRDRYGLGDGYYIYIEQSLRSALSVVRRAQGADAETRSRFARNPQVFLKQSLGAELDETIIEQLFIPTEQYSRRIVDLGIWEPVVLPWVKRAPNAWLPPEQFGILVEGKRIEIKPEDIPALKSQLEEAIHRSELTVIYADTRIPAKPETLEILDRFAGLIKPSQSTAGKDDPDAAPDQTAHDQRGPAFLTVDENYETLAFQRECIPRLPKVATDIPPALRSVLKAHQEEGLVWLQRAWCRGIPGVLLADDMGLGKTLLSLTFLCWVRDLRQSSGDHRPILVVAPTGLLRNWEAEHDQHLFAPGLGGVLRAYGQELRFLRQSGNTKGRDTELGQPQLDTARLREADWILTTYETLRDYHLSFATVPTSVIIYDEIQKLKNPASQLSRAAKTVNAEFAIGLTGTPIENRLEDLWAIMDVIYPGYLGDLKGFSETFREEDIETLKALKKRLMDQQVDMPPVMLRRMKSDRLPGLPEKIEKPLRNLMPEQQANAYTDIVSSAFQNTGHSKLKTLHKLRSVSLHPVHPNQWDQQGDNYISWSARLVSTFQILDQIAARREKALIFLESLEMQEVLSVKLKQRYRLPRRPMLINGAVAGPKRQDAVDLFQSRRTEFDVMILSPKAGGVGLTLTAANHVIHLSRWWNPAVEDQCTDRVFRIGQERGVFVYYPISVHPSPEISDYSFDLKLHELLERKRALSRDVLLPPEGAKDAQRLFESIMRPSDGVHESVASFNDTAASLDEIDRMDPIQFEHWVLKRLAFQGFNVQETPRSGDGGADGILMHCNTGITIIVQCKHRQREKCDDMPIDELLRARTRYDLPEAGLMAVSNMDFTIKAKTRAQQYGITLTGREKIAEDPPEWV